MSVFRVKLNNTKQGRLDINASTDTSETYGNIGSQFSVSQQRQIYVAGPNRIYRLLKDGEEFTDCNYWKRFTAEVVGEEYAFIEVVSDDGSIYSDILEDNTFSVGATVSLTTNFADTVIDFVNEHGAPARFVMIQNLDGSIGIIGELNGNTNITFAVGAGETMMFNQGDIVVKSLRLKSLSGTPDASYIASIRSICNS
jgi:hypothetical protein